MATQRGRLLPVLIVSGVAAVAVGVAAIVDRVAESRNDRTPAPPGTPQLGARLPIGLWPSDGSEPMVAARGPQGWDEMLAALYHRDTVIDDAARARAIVIADRPRREQDARREFALEAHVLRGAYEPALIAAAWLAPLDRITRPADLAAFGISDTAIQTLQAVARVDADPDLIATWRREFGIEVVRPRVTEEVIAATSPERRGMLWALLLDLARERVAERQALPNPSRG
jgi:hypothetical protein